MRIPFQRRQPSSRTPSPNWYLSERTGGLCFEPSSTQGARALHEPLLTGWLEQLEDDGLAERRGESFHVSWPQVYSLGDHADYAAILAQLGLPPSTEATPELRSQGSLADPDFAIGIAGWHLDGQVLRTASTDGAVLTSSEGRHLLSRSVWELVETLQVFAMRGLEERTAQAHQLAWGRLRRVAANAGAKLDSFLHRTVVLTPETLQFQFRKVQVGEDTVIEVQPGFDGEPAGWLRQFDQRPGVPERYDLPAPDGSLLHVVPSAAVRTVLEEIKRFPDRRVAGRRAQAFMLNPYATLGTEVSTVIDTEQFEQARQQAGLEYERFLPQFERDAEGYPETVGLLIESANATGPTSSVVQWLENTQLAQFIARLRRAIEQQFPLLAWDGYNLELHADAPEHLQQLTDALAARQQPRLLIRYGQVHDLSQYTERVEEIGYEKSYFSPYIAKKDDGEGWFPDNIVRLISWVPEGQTEIVSIPVGAKDQEELRRKLERAKANGEASIQLPGVPRPIPVTEAERILGSFDHAQEAAAKGHLDPGVARDPASAPAVPRPPKRKSLVGRSNIDRLEYAQARKEHLSGASSQPDLPRTLRPDVSLKAHQLEGLAWLQTLYMLREAHNCRGAVLADDMGLGKTLQLLALMAGVIEQNPGIHPMLIVAPLSLLENWKEEALKFFEDGSLPLLTAYGEGLAELRVPPEQIEERLRTEDGLVRFLRPDWVGDAKVVLTTYETLRDLEFSFASQRWSIMVCDEAQKIKNPAAMVTRAAKKQNVAFKIACTGTPVENTLADLWCLFDFVQPGLLGALNEFGRRYRKPIEARSEGEKARVEELRALIAPQILRRTKAEVAKDLPRKIEVEHCRKLRISAHQQELYAQAVELFRRRNEPGFASPFRNPLVLLHYLRLLCTDPRRHGLTVFTPEPLAEYRQRAPKLHWLIEELERIRDLGEKVIVFCEFREIQRLLQFYISQSLGVHADIINGDTSAAASSADSRQKRIKAFQAKPGFGVIILSPVAVGFGVNIQGANHVIHYTRTWNPAKEDQATDRAYRIGQTKDVYVYYPVVQADGFTTFDVKLDQLLASKRQLAGDMLNGSGDLKPGEFDIDHIAPEGHAARENYLTIADVLRMEWQYFEALIAVLYAKRGFDTQRTPGSGDHGVDVVALQREAAAGKLIQAKTCSVPGKALNWDAIKEVCAGHGIYSRQYPGVQFDLVCVTNQYFDPNARRSAGDNDIELIEQPQLAAFLEEAAISLAEVEQILYADWAQT